MSKLFFNFQHFTCKLVKTPLQQQSSHSHTLFKNFVTTVLWEKISSSASSSSCSPRCLFSYACIARQLRIGICYYLGSVFNVETITARFFYWLL